MAEDDFSRSEQATPKHRAEARKRGQVAKSLEVYSTLTIVTGLLCLMWLGPMLGYGLIDFTRNVLGSIRQGETQMLGSEVFLMPSSMTIFGATAAWLGILFGTTIIAGFSQVGFEVSELRMRWESLNPLQGLQRLFSLSNVVRTLVTLVKLVIIILVCKSVVTEVLQSELFNRQSSAMELISFLMETTFALGWRVALAMIVISLADYAYQRWHHEKNLRMTKEEVKEEGKQSEPNPQVRGKIRRMMFQRMKQRMMKEVPKATVVITNPTHVAVALRYDRHTMKAPRVVAKGLRLVAGRIKEIARESGVPVIENVPLARGLYRHCKVGNEIPSIYFQAVAIVLAQVYRLAAERKKSLETPASSSAEELTENEAETNESN